MIDSPKTLQQYLLEQLKNHPEKLELVMAMSNIATIGKLISAQTNRAGLTDLRGLAQTTNIQHETQARLDVYANNLCKNYLKNSGLFAALASEEEAGIVKLNNLKAKYVIAFDPLDGSSNIDVNVSVGTIFSVLKKLKGVPTNSAKHFLQSGNKQVLAGYILYGSSTMLVFSWGSGVHEFTLDVDLGEFILSNAHLTVPNEAAYYSFNESYAGFINLKDQAYLALLKTNVPKQRWIGSLVADFHRNLLKGGVFFMPGLDSGGKKNFKPKLRLIYELNPMAYLVKQAGGAATNGETDILEILPKELHQREAIIIGNKNIVKLYKEAK